MRWEPRRSPLEIQRARVREELGKERGGEWEGRGGKGSLLIPARGQFSMTSWAGGSNGQISRGGGEDRQEAYTKKTEKTFRRWEKGVGTVLFSK